MPPPKCGRNIRQNNPARIEARIAYICRLDAGKCLCSSKSELIDVVDRFAPERKLIGNEKRSVVLRGTLKVDGDRSCAIAQNFFGRSRFSWLPFERHRETCARRICLERFQENVADPIFHGYLGSVGPSVRTSRRKNNSPIHCFMANVPYVSLASCPLPKSQRLPSQLCLELRHSARHPSGSSKQIKSGFPRTLDSVSFDFKT